MLIRYAALQTMCESEHHHRVGSILHLAVDDMDPSLDEESEIDDAEEELDGIRTNKGYWPRIKEKLLSLSSSQDAAEAVKEWVYGSMWVGANGVCELCGYNPIKYHFQIRNQITRNTLVVGSECIYNYLEIPGVPDPSVLKKRLNQLRTRMKAQAEGLSSEEALRQFQEIELLERSLYQRIQALSKPENDFDAKVVEQSLLEVIRLYHSLRFIPTTAFKTCQDANRLLVKLVKFSTSVGKRAKKLQGHGMVDTVQAIMRLREDADKKANLVRMKEMVDDIGRLGTLSEIVSRGWDSLKESRQAIIAKVEQDLRTSVQQLEDRYADELAYLKHYEYLYFTLETGVTSRKDELTKSARAVVDYVQSDEFLTGGLSKSTPGFIPQSTLSDSANVHVRSANTVVKIVDQARAGLKWANEAVNRKGYTLSLAEFTGIWLECIDEGVVEITDPVDQFLDQFESDGVQRIARKIAPKAIPPEGMTVVDAMTQAWGVDIEAVWKRISSDTPREASFAEDLTTKFLAGKQRTLTFNQMGIIKRKLQLKPVPNSMWDKLKGTLKAPYAREKTADFEPQIEWSYGR